MYLGAKLGWDEDEELFGRVPVGFGPEGPAIFLLGSPPLTQKTALVSVVSKLLQSDSVIGEGWVWQKTGVAFKDIQFEVRFFGDLK